MNSNKYLPPLICGFGAAALITVPGIKNIGFCLIVPLASFFSLYLFQKVTKFYTKITPGFAIKFGVLTGIFSAIFATFIDVIITYITRTNDFIQTLPQSEAMLKSWHLGPMIAQTLVYFQQISNQITTTGFSALYTFAMFFSNSLIYAIFGLLGGLLGMTLINKKYHR
ncbi:MAG TPA: hypothetical protein ENI76_08510 [Ignavibacteria bacterium]|nr:hypothetical protein [Ignavibacteria bacterium]